MCPQNLSSSLVSIRVHVRVLRHHSPSVCLLSKPLSSTGRASLFPSPSLDSCPCVRTSPPPHLQFSVSLPLSPLGAKGKGSPSTSPSTREPLLSSSENSNGGSREMPPADGEPGGTLIGGRGVHRKLDRNRVPSLLPTQAGSREPSALSCPSAGPALRASSLPRPFRKVAPPRRVPPAHGGAFQCASHPAARNKGTNTPPAWLQGPSPAASDPSLTFSPASPWTHLLPQCPSPAPASLSASPTNPKLSLAWHAPSPPPAGPRRLLHVAPHLSPSELPSPALPLTLPPLSLASSDPQAAPVPFGGRQRGRASPPRGWGPRGRPPEPHTDPGSPRGAALPGGDR